MSGIHNTHNKIALRFLRDEHSARDDYVVIKYKGEDAYQIWYHDSSSFKKNLHHVTVLSGEELDEYLYNLFVLLSVDAEPFPKVQIDMPCCPSIMLRTKDLSKASIRNTLNRIMPMLCVVGRCVIPVSDI